MLCYSVAGVMRMPQDIDYDDEDWFWELLEELRY